MEVREAKLSDNLELQELQVRCPQGTTLIVCTVNTPNFFARVKAYEDYQIYVALENDNIIGSAACAIRDAVVNDKIEKVRHVFQIFVDPEYHGRRIASYLHQAHEKYLKQRGAVLSYALIVEGNIASMRYIAREGFELNHTLVMPGLAVFREMAASLEGRISKNVSK